MYMSYCRFEGTAAELRACLADVEEHIYEEAEYEVSEREIEHFKNMVENFVEFLGEHGITDPDGEIDQERLEEVCDAMRQGISDNF